METKWPILTPTNNDSPVVINNSCFTIGRSLICNFVIASHQISRVHCTIKKIEDHWQLIDNSTNGTHVNKKLYKKGDVVKLKPGDLISLHEAHQFTYSFNNPQENSSVIEIEDSLVEPNQIATTNSTTADYDILLMESELVCSICTELFVKAMTLNCSHTFCDYCISEWRKNKRTCPVCRHELMFMAPTMVLDNYIDKKIEACTAEVKEAREKVVKEREELMKKLKGSASKTVQFSFSSITHINLLDNSDDDDDEEEDDDYYDERDEWEDDLDGYHMDDSDWSP